MEHDYGMAQHAIDSGDQWARAKPRRRFIRYRTDPPISVRAVERDLEGCCDIISEGGMGGTLAGSLSVGNVVHLQFRVPTHPALIEVLVIVRDQQDLHHGFEFVSLTDAEQAAIRQFCNGLTIHSETGRIDP